MEVLVGEQVKRVFYYYSFLFTSLRAISFIRLLLMSISLKTIYRSQIARLKLLRNLRDTQRQKKYPEMGGGGDIFEKSN